MTYDNHPLDLVEHGFDIALRSGPLPDSAYSSRLLGWSRARLAASPAYLDRMGRPTTPQQLYEHALLAVGDSASPMTWRLRNEAGVQADVVARPVLVSNESTTIIRQVASGAGIALLSTPLMAHRLAEGILELVLPDWYREKDVAISVIFASHATLDRKVRAFIDFAVEKFAGWRASSCISPDIPASSSLTASLTD